MTNKSTLLLEHHLKELKLPTFQREYRKLATQCAAEGTDHPDYLLRLAELELIDRHQRMVQRRIRPRASPRSKAWPSPRFPGHPLGEQTTGHGTGPLRIHRAPGEHHSRRKQRHRQDPHRPGPGRGRLPEGNVRGFHYRRGPSPRTHGGQGRPPTAQPPAATGPPQAADHRRVGLRAPVHHRRGTPLRGSSASVTSGAPSWSPPTCLLTSGPACSARKGSPEPCWTGSPTTSISWK